MRKPIRSLLMLVLISVAVFGGVRLTFAAPQVVPDASGSSSTIYSNWASIVPTIDGTVYVSEWSDAAQFDISPGGESAWAFVKNDDQWVYLAVIANFDTTYSSTGNSDIVEVFTERADLPWWHLGEFALFMTPDNSSPGTQTSLIIGCNCAYCDVSEGAGAENLKTDTGQVRYELKIPIRIFDGPCQTTDFGIRVCDRGYPTPPLRPRLQGTCFSFPSGMSYDCDPSPLNHIHLACEPSCENTRITVDRGEGSTYCIGDSATVCYSVSRPTWMNIWVITEAWTDLLYRFYDDGTGDCWLATVGEPTGVHTLRIEETDSSGSTIYCVDETWFWVEDCRCPDPPVLNPIDNSDCNDSYTVSWSSVSGATSYKLQEDDNPAFSSPTTVYQGPSTSKYITGKSPDTYYYRVRASTADCTTDWSNTESVKVWPIPAAPTLYSINNPDCDNKYTVSWSSVSDADSYTLQEDDNPSFSSPSTVYQGASTSKYITGKSPGTYYYRVKANNCRGSSGWSNTQSVKVWPIPAAPNLYSISNPDCDGDYTVSWSSVTDATRYELQEDNNSSFSSPSTVYSGAATSKAITGKGGGTWYYRVRACNCRGCSNWSNTRSVSVLSAPTLYSINNSDCDDKYTVSWSSVSGASSYTLQEDDNASFSSPTTVYQGASTSKYISGKSANTYYYRVRASTASCSSGWSNVKSVKVWPIPSSPTLYSISNPDGDGNYTVRWSSVSDASSYRLEEDDNSAFSSPVTVYSGLGTSKAISGKSPDTYYYRVRAENCRGNSNWSNWRSVTVQAAPSTPTLYSINNPDCDGDYTVSWSSVSGATSYELHEDDNPNFSSPVTVVVTGTPEIRYCNMSPGTYYYRVRACNAAGCSNWSSWRSVRVWPIPSAPTLYSISNPDGDGNYTVRWSSVSDASSYRLEEDDNSSFSSPVTVYSGLGTSKAISGKSPDTYYYRVRAENCRGNSDWSSSVEITVQEDKPDLYLIELSESPYIIYEGDQVEFTMAIKNGGDADAAGPFDVQLYIDGSHVCERIIDSLSAGSTIYKWCNWTAGSAGSYTARAEVDAGGFVPESNENNNAREHGFTVRQEENQCPTADLDASPRTVKTQEAVHFNACASSDPDGSIVSYWFDYDDGSDSGWVSQCTQDHVYTDEGTYYAEVKVKDDDGCVSDWSSSVEITVQKPPDPVALLAERFAPILYLHKKEHFQPRVVDMMIDDAELRNSVVISDPTIADLYTHYTDDHYLDIPELSVNCGVNDDDYAARYKALVDGGDYDVTTYARVTTDSGRVVVQYWLFYHYNNWGNCHEGDWEMVELLFPKSLTVEEIVTLNLEPGLAAYAQHISGRCRWWTDVTKEESTRYAEQGGRTHPVVYVARGSHASYFNAGSFFWGGKHFEPERILGIDRTQRTTRVEPKVVLLPDTPISLK